MTRCLRPHRALAAGALACLLAGSGLSILGPLAIGRLLDEGIGRSDAGIVVWAALAFLAIEVARQGADALQTRVLRRLGQEVVRDLRFELFEHLQRVSMSYFLRTPPGQIAARLSQDAAALGETVAGGAVGMLRDLAVFAGICMAVLAWHPTLGAVGMGSALLLSIPAVLARRSAETTARRAREAAAMAQAVCEENLAGLKIARLFGLEEDRARRFSKANEELTSSALAALRVRIWFEGAGSVAAALALSIVLWVGGRELATGTLSLGLFVALIQYVPYLLGAVQGVMDKSIQLLAARAAGRRVWEILEIPESPRTRVPASPRVDEAGLVVEELRFGYQRDREVLKGLSFVVRPGERVAVIGRTGAGKTTLARLLARLEDPWAGSIRWQGHDLRDLPIPQLRESVAYLPQEPAMAGLSPSERQRRGLDRVLSRTPELVILDEPTSQLDPRVEATLLAALERLLEGKTAILIAHRRSMLRMAHRVLEVREGRVVEEAIVDDAKLA